MELSMVMNFLSSKLVCECETKEGLKRFELHDELFFL